MSENMLTFHKDNKKFNYRAVGVVIHNNNVLIHRAEKDDFWALPGGRVGFFETSADTLVREMQEELGIDIEVERLLWVAENFFEFEEMVYHEKGFYHLLKLNDNNPLCEKTEEFFGNEEDTKLIFKWYPIDKLEDLKLYPSFLKRSLTSISEGIEHMIEKDVNKS